MEKQTTDLTDNKVMEIVNDYLTSRKSRYITIDPYGAPVYIYLQEKEIIKTFNVEADSEKADKNKSEKSDKYKFVNIDLMDAALDAIHELAPNCEIHICGNPFLVAEALRGEEVEREKLYLKNSEVANMFFNNIEEDYKNSEHILEKVILLNSVFNEKRVLNLIKALEINTIKHEIENKQTGINIAGNKSTINKIPEFLKVRKFNHPIILHGDLDYFNLHILESIEEVYKRVADHVNSVQASVGDTEVTIKDISKTGINEILLHEKLNFKKPESIKETNEKIQNLLNNEKLVSDIKNFSTQYKAKISIEFEVAGLTGNYKTHKVADEVGDLLETLQKVPEIKNVYFKESDPECGEYSYKNGNLYSIDPSNCLQIVGEGIEKILNKDVSKESKESEEKNSELNEVKNSERISCNSMLAKSSLYEWDLLFFTDDITKKFNNYYLHITRALNNSNFQVIRNLEIDHPDTSPIKRDTYNKIMSEIFKKDRKEFKEYVEAHQKEIEFISVPDQMECDFINKVIILNTGEISKGESLEPLVLKEYMNRELW